MKVGMVITNDNPEGVWNAFRLANLMLTKGESVSIFLNGPAVQFGKIHSKAFPVSDLAMAFVQNGGILSG